MAEMKRYVLRADAGLTAIDLFTILSKLGTIPTYVNVPEGVVVEDHLRKYFVDTGVTLTDGVPESPSQEGHSETASQTSVRKPKVPLPQTRKKR